MQNQAKVSSICTSFVEVVSDDWESIEFLFERALKDVEFVQSRRIVCCVDGEDLDCFDIVRVLRVDSKPGGRAWAPAKLTDDRPATIVKGLVLLSGKVANRRIQLFFRKGRHGSGWEIAIRMLLHLHSTL